jgi:hypothetical protein
MAWWLDWAALATPAQPQPPPAKPRWYARSCPPPHALRQHDHLYFTCFDIVPHFSRGCALYTSLTIAFQNTRYTTAHFRYCDAPVVRQAPHHARFSCPRHARHGPDAHPP